jgi:hypothetical protein
MYQQIPPNTHQKIWQDLPDAPMPRSDKGPTMACRRTLSNNVQTQSTGGTSYTRPAAYVCSQAS